MSQKEQRPKGKGHSLPRVRGVALGSVIAVRRLESVDHPGLKIKVEVGKPRRSRGRDDYFCPYRIRGVGDEVVRAVYGVDAIQALQLVMYAIGSALARQQGLRFCENEDLDEDLGFPGPEDLYILSEAKKRRAPLPPQE